MGVMILKFPVQFLNQDRAPLSRMFLNLDFRFFLTLEELYHINTIVKRRFSAMALKGGNHHALSSKNRTDCRGSGKFKNLK